MMMSAATRSRANFIGRLTAAGVSVCGFNEKHKFLRLLGPMRLNYRNHRKLVVDRLQRSIRRRP
jgi:phosphatidylserine/phosphatidylglycerophosphate/cardiolipin synthase-like enzyme